METGDEIIIEERSAAELRKFANAPAEIPTFNPAFDVTPIELITGIVTEKGTIWNNGDVRKFFETGGKEGGGFYVSESTAVLTTSTVASYVTSRKIDGFTDGGSFISEEIHGGNLNYAFKVTNKENKSVFVKQAPDFIKCLGPEAKLHSDRLLLEVRT